VTLRRPFMAPLALTIAAAAEAHAQDAARPVRVRISSVTSAAAALRIDGVL